MNKKEVLNLLIKLCEENNAEHDTTWSQWLGAGYIIDCYAERKDRDGGEVDMSELSDADKADIIDILELCIEENRSVCCKEQNAEIWGGNKAPDGSPIFDDQTCYAIVDNDVIQFWIFEDDEIEGLDPEDYDWQNPEVLK